jgi:hypothetical protein
MICGMSEPSVGTTMTNYEVLAITVAGLTAVFALFLWLNARKGMKNQTFLRLLEEYSTPQMLYAVQSLHDLRNNCKGKDIRAAFSAMDERETLEYKKALLQDQPLLLERSINNSRRTVSHFYYRLLTVVRTRVVPKSHIFRYWNVGGLQLIPNVIQKLRLDDDKELDDLYGLARRYRADRASLIVFYILLGLYTLIAEGAITYFALRS